MHTVTVSASRPYAVHIGGGLLDRANQEARTAVDSLLRIMPGLEEYTLTVK